MSETLLPALIVSLVFVVLMWVRRSGGASTPAEPIAVPDSGRLLIDVRSPMEFRGGHLRGAINIPLGAVSAQAEQLGPKDREIVLYCRSGNRSGMALQQLKRLGFTRLRNLGGVSQGPGQGFPMA